MTFVVDTSALVTLSGIRRLDLLRACCGRVVVPLGVRGELVDQGGGWLEAADAQAEILRGEWIETTAVRGSPVLRMLRAKLGLGEAESIELARVASVPVILDDQEARREAQRLGVPVLGSLGILARSRKLGLVEEVAPLVAGMRANGIYFSDRLILRFLNQMGESP